MAVWPGCCSSLGLRGGRCRDRRLGGFGVGIGEGALPVVGGFLGVSLWLCLERTVFFCFEEMVGEVWGWDWDWDLTYLFDIVVWVKS